MARKLTAAEIHPGNLPQHRPKDVGTERRWCDPTPEEIAERCIGIQCGWSELIVGTSGRLKLWNTI